MESCPYVAVVGGANVDIGGRSSRPPVAGDSNPGRVTFSLGGVGRNIAHNLRLLGLRVKLLTAYGDDPNGARIAQSCAALGVDLTAALLLPGGTTSTYLYLTGPEGELSMAVSDMSICEQLTPAYLAQRWEVVGNAQVVVADANLPAESLAYLAENTDAPLFVDPVSTTKAEKLRPILGRIHTLKPNRLEAELLTGLPIRSPEEGKAACRALLKAGVKRVFLSLGAQGVCAAQGEQALHLPNLPGRMVNTTGCGDAFMAGLVWAQQRGKDLEGAALAGLAAAAIALESPETISSSLSLEALEAKVTLRTI